MQTTKSKQFLIQLNLYFWMAIGAFLAAFAIQVFFIPNKLIDGGVVGIAMICSTLFGKGLLPAFLLAFNLPFLYLAYRSIGKTFLIHMIVAVLMFAASLVFVSHSIPIEFQGDNLEVVVIGGAILGIGLGLIIRVGGCLDGTEILGIIVNKKTGFTVGQVVLVCNIFVFAAAGLVFQAWHPPLLSLITYIVVIKIMDAVIVGLDETKSVIIISKASQAIANSIIHKLGLGLTVLYGRGGFSGHDQEILYVIAERLQLADLKELIFEEDPSAFIAIENLHEIANGNQGLPPNRRPSNRIEKLVSHIFKKRPPFANH